MKVIECPVCGKRSTKRFFLKRALAKAQLNAVDMEQQMILARAERDQLEVMVKTIQARR